jgi:thioredoxin reductase
VYDVIIVGGGPAGLSAALVLGRCRRRVLLCDGGSYRNDASPQMHGFLSRDGVSPETLRRIGREQLAPYRVDIRTVVVTDARRDGARFEATLAGGEKVHGRKLILATGVRDELPDIPGLTELYGTSVHHCPYCDGWEERDEPIAVYGQGESGVKLALSVRTWSADIVLCTNGAASLPGDQAARLARCGIPVREAPIERLEGKDGRLTRIVFGGGGSIERSALFLTAEQVQRSNLARKLGCVVSPEKGVLADGKCEETHVKGVFVAGDASKDRLLAIVAASEGAKAAFGVNCELQEEEEEQEEQEVTVSSGRAGPSSEPSWMI